MPLYAPARPSAPTAATTATVTGSTANDVQVTDGPTDTISELRFSGQANHLASASWDGKVFVYDHTQVPSGTPVAQMDFDKPVLTCDWSPDGRNVVAAGIGQEAKLQDLAASGVPAQVAAHDAPIKSVRYFSSPMAAAPMIVTGSWDKTIRYWDLRTSTPAATLTCSERVYSMDAKGNLLVAATADKKLHLVDLKNPTTFSSTEQSTLKMQIRCVASFADGEGYGMGTVEGRCGVRYVEKRKQEGNFTFKCHRDDQKTKVDVYSINTVQIFPVDRTIFATAGSDGIFNFWDKDKRRRLSTFPAAGGAITSTAFNHDGSLFAYAVGYDWSKGYSSNTPQYPTKVMIHPMKEAELKK